MYLGIDLGTSGVKVVIVDEDDQILAQASSSLTVSRLKNRWSEQDPKHWWRATNLSMEQLQVNHGKILSEIKVVGLTGQMHGATLLDKNDKVLRSAILWNDGRSFKECFDIEERVINSREITGNIAMPGFTAPKLAWIKKNEPDLFESVKKVLLPKDYLRLLMTGDYASDMSDSSGTLWLDVANRKWSKKMLTATDLDQSHMPELFEGTELTGVLRSDVAQSWGVKRVPVAAGAGDNAAGAVGVGVINAHEAFLSLGTSGTYFVANDAYQPNTHGASHAFCHCIPDTWHQMSVILSAASCLSWVTKLTSAVNEKALLAEVESEDFNKPCTVMFLPYLSGERTPHNNPNAKGVFFGLSHNSTRSVLGRAVLEGVAFAFADAQRVLLDSGTRVDQISVIGGGARSQLWGKILASVLNQPLIYREGGEVGPAFGAARLARIAISKESPQSICNAGKIIKVVQSEGIMSDYYQQQYQQYRKLYTSLKNHFE